MKEIELICITCPEGCHLEVKLKDDGEMTLTGNKCARGEDYAKEEITAPKRVVTAVVATDSEKHPYLPVRSAEPVPKPLIFELLGQLRQAEVAVPIKRGDIVIADFNDTGIDVVATRSFD